MRGTAQATSPSQTRVRGPWEERSTCKGRGEDVEMGWSSVPTLGLVPFPVSILLVGGTDSFTHASNTYLALTVCSVHQLARR